MRGKFLINLQENVGVPNVDGTKTKYQNHLPITNSQSIVHVDYLKGVNFDCYVTANLGNNRTVCDTLGSQAGTTRRCQC